MKIMVLDDNIEYGVLLAEALESENYEVRFEYNANMCFEWLENRKFDLLVIDMYLKGTTAIEFIDKLRENYINIPIVILTGSDEKSVMKKGLKRGVLQYISKGDGIDVILMRIANIIKNYQEFDSVKNAFLESNKEGLRMFCDKKIVIHKGEELSLGAIHTSLLRLLLENKNKVLTRDYIYSMIWGGSYDGSSRIVDVYVTKLRKTLNIKSIKSIRGVGYEWQE